MDGNGDFQPFSTCKDLVHHPIETTIYVKLLVWSSRHIYIYIYMLHTMLPKQDLPFLNA